jgi:hypothetical protein
VFPPLLIHSLTQIEHQVAGLLGAHPAVGSAVTPSTWTRRVVCSTTAKQYSRVSRIVST